MNSTVFLKSFRLAVFAIVSALLLHSCGPKAEAGANQSAEAIASGPFFTGPNSLIAEKEVDLNNLVEGKNLTAKQLKQVSIKEVKVSLREMDSLSFEYFDDASLSIVSSDIEMMSIATLNPIESDGQSIILSASMEADLADYFKGSSYSLVLDLGLNEDLYMDEIGATIDLNLNIKYKE